MKTKPTGQALRELALLFGLCISVAACVTSGIVQTGPDSIWPTDTRLSSRLILGANAIANTIEDANAFCTKQRKAAVIQTIQTRTPDFETDQTRTAPNSPTLVPSIMAERESNEVSRSNAFTRDTVYSIKGSRGSFKRGKSEGVTYLIAEPRGFFLGASRDAP